MKRLPFVVLLFFFNPAFALNSPDGLIDYLNQIRSSAGLTSLYKNPNLHDAAQNHANYLAYNRARGHEQRRTGQGFTGRSTADRVAYAGYASRKVDENTSFHSSNVGGKESVDGLLAAIYHRFAFLSFDYDEVGVGIARQPKHHSFVFNMGNSQQRRLCEAPNPVQPGAKYFTKVCSNKKLPVPYSAYNNAMASQQAKNPELIVWPAANADDIPPAFYEEQPDPLPYHSVSGYPISVQFNPAIHSQAPPTLTQFQLFEQDSGTLVESITYMHKYTDPNRKLSEFEHVLFPSKRLKWNTHYNVKANYFSNGQEYSVSWGFRTRKLDMPMVTIQQDGQFIPAKPGEQFAVYVPPVNERDGGSQYSTRYRGETNITISFIDNHTLLIDPLSIEGETEVQFHGIRFKIGT